MRGPGSSLDPSAGASLRRSNFLYEVNVNTCPLLFHRWILSQCVLRVYYVSLKRSLQILSYTCKHSRKALSMYFCLYCPNLLKCLNDIPYYSYNIIAECVHVPFMVKRVTVIIPAAIITSKISLEWLIKAGIYHIHQIASYAEKGTLQHTLSGCNIALTRERYTWVFNAGVINFTSFTTIRKVFQFHVQQQIHFNTLCVWPI